MSCQLQDNFYAQLKYYSAQQPNTPALIQMLTTWHQGGGSLPAGLGLDQIAYQRLLARHFPGMALSVTVASHLNHSERLPEWHDLCALLLNHHADEETESIAKIVASGCLGNNHLWQDLGLWSRAELSALLSRNFPRLAAGNTHNMKWKKFFYKQLCMQEGIYVCRAPSCAVCTDYHHCFGSEE